MYTSFLVIGFSKSTICVNFGKLRRGSKSASSVTLFECSTNVLRFGIEEASEGWICLIRLRARRRV